MKPHLGRGGVHVISGQISNLWRYSFSLNSHAEQEMYTPPGTPRSRSLTRFTMRVGLEHLGQSVLLVVSISFLRSPVFAIFAMIFPISFYLAIRVAPSSTHVTTPCTSPGRKNTSPVRKEMSGKFGPGTGPHMSLSSRGSTSRLSLHEAASSYLSENPG